MCHNVLFILAILFVIMIRVITNKYFLRLAKIKNKIVVG